IYDFGDAFEGAITRSRVGEEPARTHPGGKLHSNYNLLYRLAARFNNPDAQGVADWMASLGHVCAEDFWTLLWRDPALKSTPMAALAPHHHFDDLGTVYWRSDWTPKATAFAFRAGPPEGHHVAAILDQLPDWHLEMGHAHPDAGSFILYGGGTYLTGPTGYAGIPKSDLSNTLLIDGQGQANEGGGHDAFRGYPYARLDAIRITKATLESGRADIVAQLAGAYRPELGVEKLERRFSYAGGVWTVTDTLRASKPVVLTALVHGDGAITRTGARGFVVAAKPKSLRVDVATTSASAAIAPGVLVAAGPPGNVDKGPREERGTVLKLSLPAARDATLATTLTF
ncbi:MAG TPA: heparinase II/III family protein, partial [Duganella sp.]|uniref:heparinase II/III domain-containing protein n=1 Tax=Duganella sp. TaxID=1904440 RepID=UPI002ED23C00